MRFLTGLFFLVFWQLSLAQPPDSLLSIDTVTCDSNLDDFVDKPIILIGDIDYRFVPLILGVEVSCDQLYAEIGDPTGKTGIARGILKRWTVTNASSETQNRGNGTFYRLEAFGSSFDAEVSLYEAPNPCSKTD